MFAEALINFIRILIWTKYVIKSELLLSLSTFTVLTFQTNSMTRNISHLNCFFRGQQFPKTAQHQRVSWSLHCLTLYLTCFFHFVVFHIPQFLVLIFQISDSKCQVPDFFNRTSQALMIFQQGNYFLVVLNFGQISRKFTLTVSQLRVRLMT